VLGLTLAAAALLEVYEIVFVTIVGAAVVTTTGVDCRYEVNRQLEYNQDQHTSVVGTTGTGVDDEVVVGVATLDVEVLLLVVVVDEVVDVTEVVEGRTDWDDVVISVGKGKGKMFIVLKVVGTIHLSISTSIKCRKRLTCINQ
jgi:hypothetical protein